MFSSNLPYHPSFCVSFTQILFYASFLYLRFCLLTMVFKTTLPFFSTVPLTILYPQFPSKYKVKSKNLLSIILFKNSTTIGRSSLPPTLILPRYGILLLLTHLRTYVQLVIQKRSYYQWIINVIFPCIFIHITRIWYIWWNYRWKINR